MTPAPIPPGDDRATLREDMALVARYLGPITCSAQMYHQLAALLARSLRSPSTETPETKP